MQMIDDIAGCAKEIKDLSFRDEAVPALGPDTAAFSSRAVPNEPFRS